MCLNIKPITVVMVVVVEVIEEVEVQCNTSPVNIKAIEMFSVLAKPDINTRGVGRIRDSYANPRQSRGFA